jgi:hypothetical protein
MSRKAERAQKESRVLRAGSTPKERSRKKSSPRNRVGLEIAQGELDLPHLSALLREWVVPVMVNQFLAEREAGGPSSPANSRERTSQAIVRKDAGQARAN